MKLEQGARIIVEDWVHAQPEDVLHFITDETSFYRSNCINWGMTPFLVENPEAFQLGDYIFVPGVRSHVLDNDASVPGRLIPQRPGGFSLPGKEAGVVS